MKVCPNCGKVIGFNSYFGAYICEECGWEDDTYNKERIVYFSRKSNYKITKYKVSHSSIKCKCIRKTN